MSSLIKPLFRLTVVTFIFAVLMPDTTAVAAPPCAKNPTHPRCVGPPPDPPPPDPPPPPSPGGTFSVEVFFEPAPATGMEVEATVPANSPPTNVIGGGNNKRPMLGESVMTLDVSLLDTDQLADCSPLFGMPTGTFAVSTARIPESSPEFTFVTADFFNFQGLDGVRYGVRFSPDGDGDISDDDNWLPAVLGDINILTGDELALEVTKGRGKKGPCNGNIAQNWIIKVIKI